MKKSINNDKNTNLNTEKNKTEPEPEILKSEIEYAINNLKKGKASGEDGITNELLILGKDSLKVPLYNLFNKILSSGRVPKDWKTSKIIILHKKGSRDIINNYRPISLSSTIYKLFANIIRNRITNDIYNFHSIEQAGFRSGFSTYDHLHTVNVIIEKCKEHNIPIYFMFIDYNKAFDSLEHDYIWIAMREIGIKEQYIELLREIYNENFAYISTEKKGKPFRIERGVRQGCPLSAVIFNCVLEYIFKQLHLGNIGVNINGTSLSNLRFADDAVLLSKNIHDLKTVVLSLIEWSEKIGLKINWSKTKLLTNSEKLKMTIDNQELEYVSEYIYLGQVVSFERMRNKEVNRRVNIGWKKYWSLRKIFKSSASESIKISTLQSCVYPAVLYGSQTWSLTQKQDQKLVSTQCQMLRSCLGVSKRQKVSNRKMLEKQNVKSLMKQAHKLKWKWAGHVIRMDPNRWAHKVNVWRPTERRKKGRPERRWRDEFDERIGKLWHRTAMDRQAWKRTTKHYLEDN